MRENVDHNYFREAIERVQRRLDDLNTHGVEALSSHDITIAHQGNAHQAPE